jgi:N-acetylglucosaminyl-diphospho-decaprenol L-rhamnosyltransferase
VAPVTFSIVSHGHGPLLDGLLRQLAARASLAETRTIVTLNLGDEVFDASRYPALRLEVVRNAVPKGFGANHNAAFRRCDTAWFAVLNPDLRLTAEEPFTRLLRAAEAQRRVGIIAPRVLDANDQAEDSVRANLTPCSLVRRRLLGQRAPLDAQRPAHQGAPFFWLAGMCLLINAEALRQVGGFDERFFLYCEDYDLCARMYNAGFAIVLEPEARVIHQAQRDSHRSLKHLRWHVSSLLKVWCSAAFWRVTTARVAQR